MTDQGNWIELVDRTRPVLITGAAGFIGYFLAERLLQAGIAVVGLDNLNDYYDVALKQARLDILAQHQNFQFAKIDLAERERIDAFFHAHRPFYVVNLAAQAGVRYSLENPHAYAASNLVGFLNIIEACRHGEVKHLVYASSSSVYGGNTKMPFALGDSVDHPVSLYAATKKANELIAHSYSHLYAIPATGLRFFTVYGPWGRPDMAYFKFTQAMFENRPITIFNHGDMERDFTYIDDIVEGICRLLPRAPAPNPDFDRANPDPATSWAPHRVFNIGNDRPESLMDMIGMLEDLTGRTAIKEFAPMQPGDVKATKADIHALEQTTGFRPSTPLRTGLGHFVRWYRDYYRS